MKGTYQSLPPDWLESFWWDGKIPPPPYPMTMHVAGRHHAGKWRFKQDSDISLGQDKHDQINTPLPPCLTVMESENRRRYVCRVCPRSYTQVGHLRRHERSRKQDSRVFPVNSIKKGTGCLLIPNYYTDKDEEPEFNCPFCHGKFTRL